MEAIEKLLELPCGFTVQKLGNHTTKRLEKNGKI
jgi:hypothetical protein